MLETLQTFSAIDSFHLQTYQNRICKVFILQTCVNKQTLTVNVSVKINIELYF